MLSFCIQIKQFSFIILGHVQSNDEVGWTPVTHKCKNHRLSTKVLNYERKMCYDFCVTLSNEQLKGLKLVAMSYLGVWLAL